MGSGSGIMFSIISNLVAPETHERDFARTVMALSLWPARKTLAQPLYTSEATRAWNSHGFTLHAHLKKFKNCVLAC